MKVTTKGQVTIPQSIRKYLGITSETEVDFVMEENRVLLVTKVAQANKSKFSKVVGILSCGLSTEDITKMTRA